MLTMNRICVCLLLMLSSITLYSQVMVEQEVSRVDLLIGEQAELKTSVLVDANQQVNYPIFHQQNYMDGVEVVREGKVDTTLLNSGKRMQLNRTYVLTSFDSAFYSLPVDTTNANEFAGPYTVTSIPFQWSYGFWVLLLIIPLLVYLIIRLYQRVKKNTPITKRIVINPPTPAHQQALAQFATIKAEQPETDEDFKQYYDQLTEVLRQYIEDRFSLNAKELTSDEIIRKLTDTNNASALRELKEILTTADLVKFAKYQASLSEANRSVAMALDYVNTTRLSDEQLPQPEVKIVTIGETKQRNIRISLIVLMVILGLSALCLLGYVLAEIYECFIA